MAFEEPTDQQDTEIDIDRSILWGLWKQKIYFEGKYSVFLDLLKKFRWRKNELDR